jgi:WD40 repeat protein
MSRSFGLLVAVALTGAVVLWWLNAGAGTENEDGPDPFANAPSRPADETTLTVLTPKLDPARRAERPGPAQAFYDAVEVSPCTLAPRGEQDVSSQVDGVFQEVVVELGQRVRRGQLLGRLDDRQLRPQVALLELRAASRSAELIAKAQRDEADGKVKYARRANRSGLKSVSDLEYQNYLYQRERFTQEMHKAREDREAARQELEKARRLLELHRIRSRLDGEIVKIYKRSGEAVKQGEPLFRIANYRRLRVEGLCKVQQANLIRVGMRALVEPEQRGEQMTELNGHTGAVTGLAVSGDGRWVASGSEDRTVMLWRWPQAVRRAILPHPGEVRAVAFAPRAGGGVGRPAPSAWQLASGCADARLRLWSISPRGRVRGPVVFPTGHEGAIRTVAFSADGKWLATGGEDKRIGVWDVARRKRLYWLHADVDGQGPAHRGAVTAVHFTPDRHLVSAGRDNVLKSWKLGAGSAQLVGQQPGRSGDAAQLGLSPDGRRVLFDHAEELRILDRTDWACLGSFRNRRLGRFQALALFSPSGRLVLAAAGNGRLQLWKVPPTPEITKQLRQGYAHGFRRDSLLPLLALASPPGLAPGWVVPMASRERERPEPSGRSRSRLATKPQLLPQLWGLDGYEVRYFLTPNTAAVTCGAFAPDEAVVFTGGTDQRIRVWAVPPASQWREPIEAEITFVGSQVERGTNTVRVRAELDNPRDPERRLRPGTHARLRLYPETAPQ